MSRIFSMSFGLCVILMLSACSSASAPATPTPTAILATAIPASTSTPASTRTPAPPPTAVPVGALDPAHPEAGPRPADAAGQNDHGEWIKPGTQRREMITYAPQDPAAPHGAYVKTVKVDTKDVTYVYRTVTDPKRNQVIAEGWYWQAADAPLIDELGFPTTGRLQVWCQEGIFCPTFQHPPTTLNQNGPSFSRTFYSAATSRVMGKPFQFVTMDEKTAFKTMIESQAGVPIPFTTKHGDEYTYQIRPQSSLNIFIRSGDLADPDFLEPYVHASISGNDNGDLNVVEYAPKSPQTHLDFVVDYFVYPYSIFYTHNMSETYVLNVISSPAVGFLAEMMIREPYPYFTLTP